MGNTTTNPDTIRHRTGSRDSQVSVQDNSDHTTSNAAVEQESDYKIDLETLFQIYSAIHRVKMKQDAETMTSNKINMKTDFKIYVGIDFGTNGCGIAYATPYNVISENNDDDDDDSSDDSCDNDNKEDEKYNYEAEISDGFKITPHQWSDLAYDNSKLNTCILLNDKNELQMVGNLARVTFTEMQQKNWKLFDNFKMSLYENGNDEQKEDEKDDNKDNEPKKDQKIKFIQLKNKIKSYNGMVTESDIVFCATLKYLKESALKYINERLQIKNIIIDDIQWILTIPAIWSNESKHMMRQWGLASGLINENITNHLKIVLEPECASLQIQYEFGNKFQENDKYILVDAGGGTVDIVAHEIYSDFGVNEITQSCGGPFGSINIDKKLDELFDALFLKENMNNFRTNRPKEYVKWLENVVTAKRGFYLNGETNIYHSIELDLTFYNSIKNKKFNNSKFSKYIKSVQEIFGINAINIGININNKESMFKISKSGIDYVYLQIHKNLWKRIFDDNCLNDIINTIKSIMTQNNILNDLKYIFMVGGLSQSKYYQKRMKDEFKSVSIIIPNNPLLTVVCGAARYGYKSDFIHTRILKQTYCVRVSQTYQTLMLDHTLRDLVKYVENEDKNEEKNDENEELITKLIETLKQDEKHEDFNDNKSDEEMRKLIPDKIKPELDEKPLPKEWIQKNVTINGMTNDFICNNLLSILAKRGDQIVINSKDKISRTYHRWSKEQKISTIEIYCSDQKNPRMLEEAKKLCEGTLVYPETEDLDVIFEVSFDDSLLIAYVYPKGKENERAELALEYQTN
eukprot:132017_1